MGVDLDHCREAGSGVIQPWAVDIVKRLDSYTEASVSGTGIHIICTGSLPPGGRRREGIEMYDAARFFVMTGDVIRGVPVQDRTSQLAALHVEIFGAPRTSEEELLAALGLDANDRSGKEGITDEDLLKPLTDDEVLTRAASAANGAKFLALWRGDLSAHGGDHSAADLALVNILMFWTHGDRAQADRLFRQSNLMRRKWERADYRARTFDRAVSL